MNMELTPREQYALAAMQGILAGDDDEILCGDDVTQAMRKWFESVARHAFVMADAMIDEAYEVEDEESSE